MRRLPFFAAASLGLGVAFIVDRPEAFAHCSNAECEKVCKTWDQKANNWKKKFGVYGSIKLTDLGPSTGVPGFCKTVCLRRPGHPQDKYNREKKKSTCDQYLANKDKNNRCGRSCDNPTKQYYQMSDKEKKQWRDCNKECDKKFPLPRMSMGEEEECRFSRY